jgi:carnitine O-palmitoyltransferase 1
VVLENENFEYDFEYPGKLDKYGQLLLHGNGDDRWFDKSFNLIIASNARVGFNAEHSWADAPIMAHLWEFVLHYDFHVLGYNEDGDCRLGNGGEPSAPIRLKWDFNQNLIQIINKALNSAQCLLQDVDLCLYRHSNFGKSFIKKCRLSPDAFIQMALQLAYKRDIGDLSLTYEASMTRLFREGRTETVRPVTIESKQFIDAMINEKQEKSEKKRLLSVACDRHQRAYQDAMCGKGVDRHLFCLYVISKYLEVDSEFLKEVLSEPWKLSTSQTPHGQVGLLDNKVISAGGGFGPVADDGYGVSYIVAGEDTIFFHISSKRSSLKTDSKRFQKNIEKALNDLKQLF